MAESLEDSLHSFSMELAVVGNEGVQVLAELQLGS